MPKQYNALRPMTRSEYAALMLPRLAAEKSRLVIDFRKPDVVQSCYIDSLLPEAAALEIFRAFPDKSKMMLKKSLREFKYVAAQMNQYNPLLEEIIYAFQDPRILQIVEEITGIKEMIPDEHLYAGGISLMARGNYLEPHLDNSHDKDRQNYRVLNLLYYVTPDWQSRYGGNLELWDSGPKSNPAGNRKPLQSASVDGHPRAFLALGQSCAARWQPLLCIELLLLCEAAGSA